MLGQVVIAWGHKTLKIAGIPLVFTSLMIKKLADEIFERFKETPHIQCVQEVVTTDLEDETIMEIREWMVTFNCFETLPSMLIS